MQDILIATIFVFHIVLATGGFILLIRRREERIQTGIDLIAIRLSEASKINACLGELSGKGIVIINQKWVLNKPLTVLLCTGSGSPRYKIISTTLTQLYGTTELNDEWLSMDTPIHHHVIQGNEYIETQRLCGIIVAMDDLITVSQGQPNNRYHRGEQGGIVSTVEGKKRLYLGEELKKLHAVVTEEFNLIQ